MNKIKGKDNIKQKHEREYISVMALRIKEAIEREGLENGRMTNYNESGSTDIISEESYNEKREIIEKSVKDILCALGLNLNDESVSETPKRVAKMYLGELFSGMDWSRFPSMTCVSNSMKSDQMVKLEGVSVTSTCEHHLVTFHGTATIAYIPKEKVIGLSKINRLVMFFSQRPQIQERLTRQILVALQTVVETHDVAVYIQAVHFCVKIRGVRDTHTRTNTYAFGGKFLTDINLKNQFLQNSPKL